MRVFRKKYKEYLDLWQERVEGGTIDEEKKPKNLRDRISKDELCKPKSYKLKLTDLEEHLTSILEIDAKRERSLEEILLG